MNSAIRSLVLAAAQHGIELSLDRLFQENALSDEQELDTGELLHVAARNRLKVRRLSANWSDITRLEKAFPVIARLNNGRFVVISQYLSENDQESVAVLDPVQARPVVETVTREKFSASWSGELILLQARFSVLDEDMPFSMRWMFREFYAQKVLMLQTLSIAMLLHVFTMLPIIYVMIVLDKVVNYHAYSTLYVIAFGVLLGQVFSGILGYLKKYIALFFVSKLEARLNMEAFDKLLGLPLGYFHDNQASTVVKTVQQVATLRQFIVQKIFGTIFDATSLLIYVPILILFSPSLFLLVLLFSLLISYNNLRSSHFQKGMQARISDYENQKQSTLDSAVNGIETVKTLALETSLKRDWEQFSTNSTLASLEQEKLAARAAQISSTLQQVMTVFVIFFGVLMVFEGTLSAGVLIGVNMLAGKITGPLVQLVSIATDFQRFKLAVESLSGVMNHRGEQKRRGLSPQIRGEIELRHLSFGYAEDKKVLNDISLTIHPGKKIAIVGPSGSGKTTLLRLIQGMLQPQEGTVLVDGNDLRAVDKEHLRINVSMLSRYNRFFTESIRDNVLHPMPTASRERLQWAYQRTGLVDAIANLPDGEETVIDADGSNLPTSMLQKIAIARALIRNPKVLLMDEVMSGLSVDDEISLLENMPAINQGRTVIIVTHQLSQVIDSDQIIVLSADGRVIEQGTHVELLDIDGQYAHQWSREMRLRTFNVQFQRGTV